MASLVDNETIIRYLHVLSGIVWIGMLYFFNLVNLPLLKFSLKRPFEVNMTEKAALAIIARTLFWFRWGAAATVLFGLMLLEARREASGSLSVYFSNGMPGAAIGLGVLLGLIMAFNVWGIFWPRQKKILANNRRIATLPDGDAEKKRLADENAPMVKTATLASRLNTWFSVPMLWGMIFGAHGYRDNTLDSWLLPLAVLAILLLLMWSYSYVKPKPA